MSWTTQMLCVRCRHPLTNSDAFYSDGRCPYCGHKDDMATSITKHIELPVQVVSREPQGLWEHFWAGLCGLFGITPYVRTIPNAVPGPHAVVQIRSEPDWRDVSVLLFPTMEKADEYFIENALANTSWSREEIVDQLAKTGIVQEGDFHLCATQPTFST